MPETRAIRMRVTGGVDVLAEEAVILPNHGPGDVLIRNTVVGLNFIDTYHRTGLYPVSLPFTPGVEGVGVVEAVGSEVSRLKPGDRVAYLGGGAYAHHVIQPARVVVKLPDEVNDEDAAAVFLKGLTAWMLLFEVCRVRPGDAALVWAAAGGVGSLLVPWAASMGVRVIAVTSTGEKAARVRANGASETVLSGEDVAARVRELTGGQGVAVAYDSVGRTSLDASLGALRTRGHFVTYGNASGPVAPVPPGRLGSAGSITMTRPSLFHYVATEADMARGAAALFGALRTGTLKADIGQRFRLSEVARAHTALESGKTVGSTILVV